MAVLYQDYESNVLCFINNESDEVDVMQNMLHVIDDDRMNLAW